VSNHTHHGKYPQVEGVWRPDGGAAGCTVSDSPVPSVTMVRAVTDSVE
jgi:hypothetical protein